MQTNTITTTTTKTRLTLRAPALRKAVDLWMALLDRPDDKRTRIQLGLVQNAGACDCPACGSLLGVEDWRRTQTSFSVQETVICNGCDSTLLLTDERCV